MKRVVKLFLGGFSIGFIGSFLHENYMKNKRKKELIAWKNWYISQLNKNLEISRMVMNEDLF